MELGQKKNDKINLREYVTDLLLRYGKPNFIWDLSLKDAKEIENCLKTGWLPNLLVAQAAEIGPPELILVETDESTIVRTYSLTNSQFTRVFVSVDLPGLNVPLK